MTSLWNDSFLTDLHNVKTHSNSNVYLKDNNKFLPDLKNGFRIYNSDRQLNTFPSFFYTENELRSQKLVSNNQNDLEQQSFFQTSPLSYGNIAHLRIASSTNVLVNGDGVPYKNDHQDPGIIPTYNKRTTPAPYGKISGLYAESADDDEKIKRRRQMKIYDFAKDIFTDGNGQLYPGFQNPLSMKKVLKTKTGIDMNGSDDNVDEVTREFYDLGFTQIDFDDIPEEKISINNDVFTRPAISRTIPADNMDEWLRKLTSAMILQREDFEASVNKIVDLRVLDIARAIEKVKINVPVIDTSGINLAFGKATDAFLEKLYGKISSEIRPVQSSNLSTVEEKTQENILQFTDSVQSYSGPTIDALIDSNSSLSSLTTVIQSLQSDIQFLNTALIENNNLLTGLSNEISKGVSLNEEKSLTSTEYITKIDDDVKKLITTEFNNLILSVRDVLRNNSMTNIGSSESESIINDLKSLQQKLQQQYQNLNFLETQSDKLKGLNDIIQEHSNAISQLQQVHDNIASNVSSYTSNEESIRAMISNVMEQTNKNYVEVKLDTDSVKNLLTDLQSEMLFFRGLYGENVSSLLLNNIQLLTSDEAIQSQVMAKGSSIATVLDAFFDTYNLPKDQMLQAITFGNMYNSRLRSTKQDVVDFITKFQKSFVSPTSEIDENTLRSVEGFFSKYGLYSGFNSLLVSAKKKVLNVQDVTDFLRLTLRPVDTQIEVVQAQTMKYIELQRQGTLIGVSKKSPISAKSSPAMSVEQKDFSEQETSPINVEESDQLLVIEPQQLSYSPSQNREKPISVSSSELLLTPATVAVNPLTHEGRRIIESIQGTPLSTSLELFDVKESDELITSNARSAANAQLTSNIYEAWRSLRKRNFSESTVTLKPEDYVNLSIQLSAIYGPVQSKMFYEKQNTFTHYILQPKDGSIPLTSDIIQEYYNLRGQTTGYRDLSHAEEFVLQMLYLNKLYTEWGDATMNVTKNKKAIDKQMFGKTMDEIIYDKFRTFSCHVGISPEEMVFLCQKFNARKLARIDENSHQQMFELLTAQGFIPSTFGKSYMSLCSDEAMYIETNFYDDALKFQKQFPSTFLNFLEHTRSVYDTYYADGNNYFRRCNTVDELLANNLNNELSALRYFMYRFFQDYDNVANDKYHLYDVLKLNEVFLSSPVINAFFFRGFTDPAYNGIVTKYNPSELAINNKFLLQFEQAYTPTTTLLLEEKESNPQIAVTPPRKSLFGKTIQKFTPEKKKIVQMEKIKNSDVNLSSKVYKSKNFVEQIKEFDFYYNIGGVSSVLNPETRNSEKVIGALNFNMNELKKDLLILYRQYLDKQLGKQSSHFDFVNANAMEIEKLFNRRNIPYAREIALKFGDLAQNLYEKMNLTAPTMTF